MVSTVRMTRSFKIPADLEQEMNWKLVSAGYGLRGKSRWICDAISKFLSFSDRDFVLECIEYAEELHKLTKSVSFRPTQEVDDLLDEWLVRVRIRIPTIEGLKSKIIRTAIIHNLLGSLESMQQISNKKIA